MPKRRRKPVQLGLAWRCHGGARKGAGRKPVGKKAGVPHRKRPALARRFPVHVTVRMLPHVWNLRSRRSFRVIGRAVFAGASRFGARLCEFSVQGNHLHLVVEAADQRALSRAMKGLSVRLARGLNGLMNQRGQVVADRYHSRILRTPTEVKRAVEYVCHNFRRHAVRRGGNLETAYIDPYSSLNKEHGIVLPEARTWLLGQCTRQLAQGPSG